MYNHKAQVYKRWSYVDTPTRPTSIYSTSIYKTTHETIDIIISIDRRVTFDLIEIIISSGQQHQLYVHVHVHSFIRQSAIHTYTYIQPWCTAKDKSPTCTMPTMYVKAVTVTRSPSLHRCPPGRQARHPTNTICRHYLSAGRPSTTIGAHDKAMSGRHHFLAGSIRPSSTPSTSSVVAMPNIRCTVLYAYDYDARRAFLRSLLPLLPLQKQPA